MKNTIVFIAFFLIPAFTYAESDADTSQKQFKEMVVYRSPTCGCCAKWIEHLKQENFNIKDIVTDDMDSIKSQYKIPRKLSSCHTAVIDGYVIEGHVPAEDIKTLLTSKADVVGITVPGMPVGTPGMEMGGKKDPFDVISFDKQGSYKAYHRYE
ncbi:MAG: DUF411 domain-containing protein [Methylococcaceae bacterium]